eukprot:COSAG06_NODE_32007_length_512_cov_5.426150_2_plen_72_part_01
MRPERGIHRLRVTGAHIFSQPSADLAPNHMMFCGAIFKNQNQNQIYSLEQYTVIPTATYSFAPPGCRTGRLA